MSTEEEIVGGYGRRCNSCEKYDGCATLHWEKEDFDLCFECLGKLFFEHLAPNYKKLEKVDVVRVSVPEKMRNRLFKKAKYQCVKCGSKDNLQIDHILPFSLGGMTKESNFQVLCKQCNLKKRDVRE